MKIKRRVLISIFLTITILILTRNAWFVFKPMPVSLGLDGNIGDVNISIVLNKRNNNKFHKVEKADKIVVLNKKETINFEVKDINFPKRLRIDFSNLKNENPIIINEVSFKNGKIKIKDFDKFSLQGGDLKIEKDKLAIYPKEENCQLLYNKKLTFSSVFEIEVELFIIILVLSYLLNYKIANYIANFKTIESKSRIEIIFLTLFFVILFLPMVWIDSSEISQKENRMLAKWKPLLNEDFRVNYNFGRDVDNFFQDRFFLRDDLIKFYYNQFIINKNLRTKKVIKGKDNWLFHGVPSAISMYKRENLFSKENLEYVAKVLSDYDDYCKKNGKKFYFYIAPSKSMVYDEFYSELIKPNKQNTLSLANQLTDYLKENTNVKVIYPQEELKQNKDKGLLYWKTDTHWNEYGAYLGYQILMREINKDLKLNELKISDFEEVIEKTGDLNKNLPKGLRVKKFEKYKKPIVADDKYYCQKTQDITDIQNCKGYLNNKSLLMFRDSFTINLIPYLASTFKKSKFIWQPSVDFNLMQEADIVVLEIVEVSLRHLIGKKVEF